MATDSGGPPALAVPTLGADQITRRPPLVRRPEQAIIAGVAAAVATHVGWPIWLIRWIFVALLPFNFLGLALYGLLWVLIPEERPEPAAPGLEAANHLGMRQAVKRKRRRSLGTIGAMTVLVVGVFWFLQGVGWSMSGTVLLPVVLATLGVVILWRQADRAGEDVDTSKVSAWARPFVASGRAGVVVRVILGLGLVGSAVTLVVASQLGFDQLSAGLVTSALIIGATLIVAAPWLHRWRRSLNQARDEKLLADARADMAAHLHDSVLQTLALIQRQADDPKAVATLARRQERELRGWLYGETTTHATLKAALTETAAEIEDERGVAVEVVCVGDAPLTESLSALVHAAREAILNAAKHSRADLIDVYAEVEDDGVEVFVRDRGVGFDPDHIAEDRLGVKGSIIERMARHGGTATIRSTPGAGTEVRLEMNR